MSMNLRYRYGFYSYKDVLYEVDIYQEGFSGEVQQVGYGESPVEIEWQETDKLEPVQSSSATVQLFSDNDRQFVDLYTVKAGSVRLDVYREGSLYWSGTLDTELYEEPFSYKDGYCVELTFSDFAMLDRLKWNVRGFISMDQIIRKALDMSGVKYSAIDTRISTKTSSGASGSVYTAVSVLGDNFFDEDDKPMTIRKVLDETLRPFSLRMIQKGGKIVLYDLNQLYSETPEEVNWGRDDAVLSVDKTYSDVLLTFSPYEKTTLLDATIDPETVTGGSQYTTYVDNRFEADAVGFRMTISDTGVDPVYSGDSEAGIAWAYSTRKGTGGDFIQHVQPVLPPTGIVEMIFRAGPSSFIYPVNTDGSEKFQLKVTLNMLFDPRYNPFEDAGTYNEQGNWEEQQDRANFVYLPIKLTLRDENRNAILHLQNSGVKDTDYYYHSTTNVKWVSGEASWGNAYLCWWKGNRKDESGLGGWQLNKQIIGYYRDTLPSRFDKMGDGEFIPFPDKYGYLELEVGTGLITWDYNKEINEKNYSQCRHWWFKDPKIELVDGYGNSIQTKDVQYSAWINKDAKENLKIDTILGTLDEPSPVALGQLYKSSDHTIVSEFTRSDITGRLEKLLIATVYSNYSGRNIVLSGTTVILPSFSTYTDKNEAGNYILLAETQDLINDTSEIKMVQFSADNYEGVEFK